MSKAIRHGEIILLPVNKLPKGKRSQHTNYIVGHSETGHHHVLESKTKFDIVEAVQLYLDIKEPAKIVQKKSYDRHKDLTIAPGKYKVIYKNEYDPFQQVIRRVVD